MRGAGGGGAAPPRTPLLFRGASPPGTPKRRSAPLAAAVVRFLATEPLVQGRTFSQKSNFYSTNHLSWAASLPGAELPSKFDFVFEQATCPGQLRCLGQNFFSKTLFFEQTTCPRQLRCLGQNFLFYQKSDFVGQATCPGQLRCLGQIYFLKLGLFFEQATCPGQLRCLGQNCFQKINLFF